MASVDDASGSTGTMLGSVIPIKARWSAPSIEPVRVQKDEESLKEIQGYLTHYGYMPTVSSVAQPNQDLTDGLRRLQQEAQIPVTVQ